MQKLEFKNVTIQYDENSVNKKKVRRHNAIMYIGTTIFAVLWLISSVFIIEGISKIISNEIAILACSLIVAIAEMLLGVWVISIISGKQYGNTNAGMWMEYIFRQNEIEVGWFNERLQFCTKNNNGARYYSLNSFLTPMKSEVVVNDESNKQGLINVTIDITNDEKTIVTIQKVETEEK